MTAGATPAAAAQDGSIEIVLNGRHMRTLDHGAVIAAADVPRDALGSLRDARGTVTRGPHGGTSVRAVLRLAELPVASVTEVSFPNVARPWLGRVTLDRAEIAGTFGGVPPADQVHDATFLEYTVGQLQFFRPLRSGTDANADDFIDTPGGTDLAVDVTTDGDPIDVRAGATPASPAAGDPVTLTATAHPGATYTWDFGDGAVAPDGTGNVVTHPYANAGAYTAYVTVIDPATGDSGAASVAVKVDPPAAGGAAKTPVAPTAPATTGSGGNGSGGGAAAEGGGEGGDMATATGRRRGTTSAGATPTDGGREGQGRAAPATGAAAPPPAEGRATTTPAAPATTQTPTTPAAPAGAPPAAAPSGRAPRRRTPPPAAPAAGSVKVAGTVLAGTPRDDLSGALAAADALAAGADRARPPVARAAAGHGWRPAGYAAGAGAVLALLALGAVREGLRPRRLRGSGRLRPVA